MSREVVGNTFDPNDDENGRAIQVGSRSFGHQFHSGLERYPVDKGKVKALRIQEYSELIELLCEGFQRFNNITTFQYLWAPNTMLWWNNTYIFGPRNTPAIQVNLSTLYLSTANSSLPSNLASRI